MAERKPPAGSADFVAKIVKDPKNPPDTLVLTGYLGASSEEGHTRLYFDAGLSNYVEIPTDAILHTAPTGDDGLGASYVWIKRDAVLIYGPAGAQRPKGTFLEGPIMQDHLAGAAGAGERGGLGYGGMATGVWPLCNTKIPKFCGGAQAMTVAGDCYHIDRLAASAYAPCQTWICTPAVNCPPSPHCPPSDFVPCQSWICPPSPHCPKSDFVPCQSWICPPTPNCPSAHLCPTPWCPPQSFAVGCITVGGCPVQSAQCAAGGPMQAAMAPAAARAAAAVPAAAPPAATAVNCGGVHISFTGPCLTQPPQCQTLFFHCQTYQTPCPTHYIPCQSFFFPACPTHQVPCPTAGVPCPSFAPPCPTQYFPCPSAVVVCPTQVCVAQA